MDKRIHRRSFLGCATAGAAGLTILGNSRSARAYYANQKLGVALVGVSGRGSWFVETAPRIGTEVVALCDVNQRRAAEAFNKFPGVPQFQDFRKMLAERDKQIDAVFVAVICLTVTLLMNRGIAPRSVSRSRAPLNRGRSSARVCSRFRRVAARPRFRQWMDLSRESATAPPA